MKLYPAIDLMGGVCVRLSKGDFDTKKVYETDPAAQLARFKAAGAAQAHVVDLDGAKDPARRQAALLKSLAGTAGLALQVGGGVRREADVEALLAAGAAQVVVGTAAVEDPERFIQMLARFGGERLTLALDVFVTAKGAEVATRGWTAKSGRRLQDLVDTFAAAGLKRLLCTDIAKDGMLLGPNVGLYAGLLKQFPTLEVQASGGVSGMADLLSLKAAGVPAAVVGKALYEGRLDLAQAVSAC